MGRPLLPTRSTPGCGRLPHHPLRGRPPQLDHRGLHRLQTAVLAERGTAEGFDGLRFAAWMTMERLTDCLDGEVARHFSRQSKVGHYLDKVSDVCFRYTGVGILVWRLFPFLWAANAWAFATLLLCLSLPGVYVYEACVSQRIKGDMNTPADSWAIYVEDGATLLCAALPWLLCAVAAA